MKISIVIPNYNGERLLRKNLPTVISTSGECEIIVVDDGSQDNSCKFITQHLPQIKIIRLSKNHGFSTAVNMGVKESSGELIMLLNSDAAPQKNYLMPLVNHFHDINVFAVGSLQKTGRHWKGNCIQGRGIGQFKKGFLVHAPGSIDRSNTLWAFGGAAMFRKSIWENIGGLNDIYNPFYWEDIDISYRALKQGYKIKFEPKSVVIHGQGQTIESSYTKNQILPIVFRNQILFIWLNITDINYLAEHLFYLPYNIVTTLLSGDFNFVKGVLMACFKLRKVINLHNQYRKKIVLSDKKLLQQFVT